MGDTVCGRDSASKVHSAHDAASAADLWCAWRGHDNTGNRPVLWEDGISRVSSFICVLMPSEWWHVFLCESLVDDEGIAGLSLPGLLQSIFLSAGAGLSFVEEDSEVKQSNITNQVSQDS